MNALRDRIPRALRNHKTPEGYEYGTYCRGVLDRLGPLPKDARPILREAGLVSIDLMRARRELEKLRLRPRKNQKAIQRHAKEIHHLRLVLMHLERRLEAKVGVKSEDIPGFDELLSTQAQVARDR